MGTDVQGGDLKVEVKELSLSILMGVGLKEHFFLGKKGYMNYFEH